MWLEVLADPFRAVTGKREAENLPLEWQTFLAEHVSAPAGWEFHDGTSAYRVALDDGQYLVLAEREGDEFILQRVEPPAERLFHLAHHDSVPKPLTGELDGVVGRRPRIG
jgi:uncharacterized protein YcaQ